MGGGAGLVAGWGESEWMCVGVDVGRKGVGEVRRERESG